MYLISNSLALTAINGCICILGDYLVDVNQESQIRKAICDNATHAIVGFFSAIVLILETNHRATGIERIVLVAMSVLVSSFIDIDHFLVAKSMKLSVIYFSLIEKEIILNFLFCMNKTKTILILIFNYRERLVLTEDHFYISQPFQLC